MKYPIDYLAEHVTSIITAADQANLALDDGNVIDLLADNITYESLALLRHALRISRYAARFPHACQSRDTE